MRKTPLSKTIFFILLILVLQASLYSVFANTVQVSNEEQLEVQLNSDSSEDLVIELQSDISLTKRLIVQGNRNSIRIRSTLFMNARSFIFQNAQAQLFVNSTISQLTFESVVFSLNSQSNLDRIRIQPANIAQESNSPARVLFEMCIFRSSVSQAQTAPYLSIMPPEGALYQSSQFVNLTIQDTQVEGSSCNVARACFVDVQHSNAHVAFQNVTVENIRNSHSAGSGVISASLQQKGVGNQKEQITVAIHGSTMDYNYAPLSSILHINAANLSDYNEAKISATVTTSTFDRNFNTMTSNQFPKSLILVEAPTQVDTQISFVNAEFTNNVVTETIINYASKGTIQVQKGYFTSNRRTTTTSPVLGTALTLNHQNAILNIQGTIFNKNNGTNGGVITLAKYSSFDISGNTIFTSNRGINGASIYIIADNAMSTTHKIQNNVFDSNEAENGGAIYAVTARPIHLDHNIFKNNVATQSGGAVFISGSPGGLISLHNVSFTSNRAGSQGCAVSMVGSGGTLNLNGTTVKNNCHESSSANAAIHTQHALTVENCQFIQNYRRSLYVTGNSNIKSLTVTGHTSNTMGSLYIASGTNGFICSHCNFTENSKCVEISNSQAQFMDCSFSNNGNLLMSEGSAAFITGQASNVIMERCTLENNRAQERGGAISIVQNSKLEIKSSKLFLNNAPLGGAIHLGSGAVATFLQTNFSQNIASTFGGAIHSDQASIIIKNCDFVANGDSSTNRGGAIFISDPSSSNTSTIQDSRFENNVAEEGACISSVSTSVKEFIVFTKNIFTKNTSPRGAVFSSRNRARVRFEECDFLENESHEGSAAILFGETYTVFLKNKFKDNILNGFPNVGGVASIGDKAQATFNENTFENNNAGVGDSSGGAIFVNIDDNREVSFTSDKFLRNSASIGGALTLRKGKVKLHGVTAEGNKAVSGSVINAAGTVEVTIHSSNFKDNLCLPTSSCIGPVYAGGQSKLYVNGTSFQNSDNTLTALYRPSSGGFLLLESSSMAEINETTFTKAVATTGGLVSSSSTGKMIFNRCKFEYGSATLGSGIHMSSQSSSETLNLNGCQFHHNYATGSGGAIYSTLRRLVIKKGNFNNNTATSGGALRGVDLLNLDIEETKFEDNLGTAISVGLSTAGRVRITDSNFHKNGGVNTGNQGGSVHILGRSNTLLTMQRVNITSGLAFSGAGLFLQDIETSLSNLIFEGNVAGEGGAISVGGVSVVNITNVTFRNNSANVSVLNQRRPDFLRNLKVGTRRLFQTSTPSGDGGAILVFGNVVTDVSQSIFTGNSAQRNGGGLALSSTATSARVNMRSTQVSGNTATNSGGGIFVPPEASTASIQLSNVQFTSNAADTGGSYFAQSFECGDCSFTDNQANVGADGSSGPFIFQGSPSTIGETIDISSGSLIPLDLSFTIRDKTNNVLTNDQTTELLPNITSPTGKPFRLSIVHPLRAQNGVIDIKGRISLFGWQGTPYNISFYPKDEALRGVSVAFEPAIIRVQECRPGLIQLNESLICEVCPENTHNPLPGQYTCLPCPCPTPAGSIRCLCEQFPGEMPIRVVAQYPSGPAPSQIQLRSGDAVPVNIVLRSLDRLGNTVKSDNITSVSLVATSETNDPYIVKYNKNPRASQGVIDLGQSIFFFGRQGKRYDTRFEISPAAIPLNGSTPFSIDVSLCPSGYYQDGSSLACLPCLANTYSPLPGSETCLSCPPQTISDLAGTECYCPSTNLYLYNDTNVECRPCPDHVSSCFRGVFSVERGFFKFENGTNAAIYRCVFPNSCLGGVEVPTRCAEGNAGPLCAACEDNYYRLGTECVECMHIAINIVIFILICWIPLPLAILLQRAARYYDHRLMVYLKIFLSYLAGILIIMGHMDMDFWIIVPGIGQALKVVLFDYENVMTHCTIPAFTGGIWMFVHAVVPIIVGVMIPIPIISIFYLYYRAKNKLDDTQLPKDYKQIDIIALGNVEEEYGTRKLKKTTRKHNLKSDMLLFPFVIFYITTPYVIFRAFQQFSCSFPLNGIAYLTADWKTTCDGAHGASIAVAVLSILVYVILVPLVQMYLTWKVIQARNAKGSGDTEAEKDTHLEMVTVNARRYGFFYKGYELPGFFFYDIFVLLRKVAFVAVIALISDPYIEAGAVLIVLCIGLVALAFGPYKTLYYKTEGPAGEEIKKNLLQPSYTESVSLIAQCSSVIFGILSFIGLVGKIVSTISILVINMFTIVFFVAAFATQYEALTDPALYIGEGFVDKEQRETKKQKEREEAEKELEAEELGGI